MPAPSQDQQLPAGVSDSGRHPSDGPPDMSAELKPEASVQRSALHLHDTTPALDGSGSSSSSEGDPTEQPAGQQHTRELDEPAPQTEGSSVADSQDDEEAALSTGGSSDASGERTSTPRPPAS
jgi:hypothetical protein